MAPTRAGIKEMRGRLEALKAELEGLSAGSAEGRKPVELDQQTQGRLSRMDAMRAQAMDQATEAKRRAEIRKIDAALARMGADEYGDCTVCGEEIPAKRLDLDPATAVCVQCASAR